MDYWGEKCTKNGIERRALVVASFTAGYLEIANVLYVGPDEILYPVPRSLYALTPLQATYMSNSQRDKKTTVLPEDSVVCVQIDSDTSRVTFMRKGGSAGFGLEKRGMDWVMEVDVAVSDEQHRQAFVYSAELSGMLVNSLVDLKSYEPNKPYKGIVKLNIFDETVTNWASKGIYYFNYWQNQFKDAGRACYGFTLTRIYETDEPNISVVYDAPWQTVKRSVVLTPAHVGDVSDDELNVLQPDEPKQEPASELFIVDKKSEDVGASVTSSISDDTETDEQKKDFTGLRLIDDSIKPISTCLSTESVNQIKQLFKGTSGSKRMAG